MGEALVINDKRHSALEPAPELDPMQQLKLQIVREGDINKLKELMILQERWEANEARRQFNEAKAAFKRNPPTIIKNRFVNQGAGKPSYHHATLDECVNKIVPALAMVGLEHSWIPGKGANGEITITCRLSGFGHHEDFTLGGMPDTGPGRNAIQAQNSTITYLERYTLLAATGLAAADTDNDGATTPAEAQQGEMEEATFLDLKAVIEGAGDREQLEKAYLAAQDAAEKVKDLRAAKSFRDEANKRRLQLKGVR